MSLLSRRGSKVNEAMQKNGFTASIVFAYSSVMAGSFFLTLQDKNTDDVKEGKSRTLPAQPKSSKVYIA